MKEKKKTAIVPGSFDPITLGHIDIVKRALNDYEKVYLAVMINSQKEYTFTLEQRVEIARAAVIGLENVEVISSRGMLWELAKALEADAIVKGYRNEVDYAYELEMAKFNEERYPKAKTVLLKSAPKLIDISSTLVRERLKNNEPIDEFLPQEAAKLVRLYKTKQNK